MDIDGSSIQDIVANIKRRPAATGVLDTGLAC